MRLLLTIALSTPLLAAPLLAGCSTYYDKSAAPDASVAWEQASQDCKAREAAHEFKTHSEMAACSLAADRAYYAAVKLKAMYKFDDYAANYQKLAVLQDANRITDEQASFRANQALRRFYSLCNCGSTQGKFGSVPGAALDSGSYMQPSLPQYPPSQF
jgi:hypothetical protein